MPGHCTLTGEQMEVSYSATASSAAPVTKSFLESLAVFSGAGPAGGSMGGNLFPSALVSMRESAQRLPRVPVPLEQLLVPLPLFPARTGIALCPEQPWQRLRAYSCPWRGSQGSPGIVVRCWPQPRVWGSSHTSPLCHSFSDTTSFASC